MRWYTFLINYGKKPASLDASLELIAASRKVEIHVMFL